jgi:hypothetical protein
VETRTSLGIIKIEHQHVFKCDAEISKSLDSQMDVVKGKQSKLNNDTAERSTFLSSLVKKIDNYQTLNSQHEGWDPPSIAVDEFSTLFLTLTCF